MVIDLKPPKTQNIPNNSKIYTSILSTDPETSFTEDQNHITETTLYSTKNNSASHHSGAKTQKLGLFKFSDL